MSNINVPHVVFAKRMGRVTGVRGMIDHGAGGGPVTRLYYAVSAAPDPSRWRRGLTSGRQR